MSPKRLFVIAGLLTVLAACGAKTTLNASATVRSADPSNAIKLMQATERVLVRRLAAADIKNAVVAVTPTTGTDAAIELRLPDTEAAEIAKRILSEPFTFEIKLANGVKKDADGAEVTDWQTTGITGVNLDWIQPVRDSSDGSIGVELQFNAEGRNKLMALFKGSTGKDVGIFVRDLLVSKLRISSDKVEESIVISGIPSAMVAEIFADDVNVGLHVAFTFPQ